MTALAPDAHPAPLTPPPDQAHKAPMAVGVQDLGKQYRVSQEKQSRFFSAILGKAYGATRKRSFWALRDLHFTIPKGRFVGIVGPNGSGKSTLLKILAGITPPSTGQFSIQGRVAGLMELGVGFHPDLSGWENVFLYGAVLGLPRRLIRSRMRLIANCAGFDGRFLDMPLKYYSSGMTARLGFSVAINADPDVLLVDEVLAVGDGEYRNFSFGRILEMRDAGKTILLVTHDLYSARDICDEMIRLKDGRLADRGAPDAIVAAHQRDMTERFLRNVLLRSGPPPDPSPLILGSGRVLGADSAGDEGGETVLKTRQGGRVVLPLQARRPVRDLRFLAWVLRDDGLTVLEIHSRDLGFQADLEAGRPAELTLDFDHLHLSGGRYTLGIACYEGEIARPLAWRPEAAAFQVDAPRTIAQRLTAEAPCRWRMDRATAVDSPPDPVG